MVPVSSKSLSASVDLPWLTWVVMEKFLSNKITQMEPAQSTKITIKKKKLQNSIYIFQSYRENNAWLHYLILLNSFMLLKHQCTCLHIRDSTKKIVNLWMAWSTSAIYPDTLEIIVICLAYWERKNKIDANAQFISITRN